VLFYRDTFPDDAMNILYLAHRFPYPPNKGDKLRAFRQIERLSAGHRLWCACFMDRPSDRRFARDLGAYCEKLAVIPLHPMAAKVRGLLGLARGSTVTESYYRFSKMSALLRNWAATTTFDSAIAFSSSMAPYVLSIPAKRRVLDMCDVDSCKWHEYADHANSLKRRIYRLEGRRLASREHEWTRQFDATIVITRQEAAELGRFAFDPRVHVVGNGVHLPPLQSDSRPVQSLTVGFVGVMSYAPNVDAVEWFVRNCWPGVRKHDPRAVFRIVGREPGRRVRNLARIGGVEVIGEVDDIHSEVQRFDVSVAPLRIARGLQNKVLEAMAGGKPVVATTPAVEGIEARNQEHILIADDAEAFGRAVVRLIGDSDLRQRLGDAGRRFVGQRFSWAPQLDFFEQIVTGAMKPAHRPSHEILPVPSSATMDALSSST